MVEVDIDKLFLCGLYKFLGMKDICYGLLVVI